MATYNYLISQLKKLFGQRLTLVRKSLNYTQEDIGRLIGISGNSVARLERGEHSVSWETLVAIVSTLGQPPEFYFPESVLTPIVPRPTPEQALEVLAEVVRGVPRSRIPPTLMRSLESLDSDELARIQTYVDAEIQGRADAEDDSD